MNRIHALSPTKLVGQRHCLALLTDGSVVGWGEYDDGQLGSVARAKAQSRSSRSSGPLAIPLPRKAVDLAAGGSTSYALLDDGTVVAWGSGASGQLGLGERGTMPTLPNGRSGSETPIVVPGLTDIVQLVAINNTALALHKDGTVYAWGDCGSGMIGDGKYSDYRLNVGPVAPSPVLAPQVSGIKQLAVGSAQVLALTHTGRVLTWGSNYNGALGRPPRQERLMDSAGAVPNLTDVVFVAGGAGISCAVKTDGTVWAWGSNEQGQFGNGTQSGSVGVGTGYQLVPQKVPGIRNVAAISLGIAGRHTLVLLKDGTIRGWGNTDWGQLGTGVSGDYLLNPVMPKLQSVRAVYALGNNSYAVRTDGSVWAWGNGGRGEWPFRKITRIPTQIMLLS